MSYQYSTITYSGLALDAFITDDQQTWLTLSSLATGINVHRQTVANWLKHNCQTEPDSIDVKVGKFNKAAKAYPVEIAVEFLKHLSSKGNKEADALLTATVVADIERSIKEANGIQVTAAQHEEVRHNARLEYLQQWVKDNYQPKRVKGAMAPLDYTTIQEAGFTDSAESQIVFLEGHIARREVLISEGKMGADQVADELRGIAIYRKDIQTLAQGLRN